MTPEWCIYLLIGSAGAALAVAIVGRRRALNVRHLAPLYLAVMLVTYLVRPALVAATGGSFWFVDRYFHRYGEFSAAALVEMGLCVAAALASFALGYRMLRRPIIGAVGPPTAEASRQRAARTVQAAVAMIVVGYASFALARRGFVGIWENVLTYRLHEGSGSYANSNGYYEMANYLVVTGAILLFAATNRLWLTALVSAPWFYNQIYFGWSRHKALVLLMGLLAVEVLRGGRWVLRTRLLMTAAGTVFLLLLLFAMRQDRFFMARGQDIGRAAGATWSLPIDRATGDIDGFEPAWVTMHQVDDLDKTYGLDILYTDLIVLIPRQIWPGKPWPTDFTWVRMVSGGDVPVQEKWPLGAVRGSIGDALREWGWPGLFLDFGLTGLLLAWAEKRFARARDTSVSAASYAAAFALVPLLGRDAVWHVLPDYLYLFLAPYLLADWWAARAVRSRIGVRQQSRALAGSARLPGQSPSTSEGRGAPGRGAD